MECVYSAEIFISGLALRSSSSWLFCGVGHFFRRPVQLILMEADIWARAPEFVVVAIMCSKTLFRRPVQPILMRAEDEEFDVFLRIQNINSRNNSLLV